MARSVDPKGPSKTPKDALAAIQDARDEAAPVTIPRDVLEPLLTTVRMEGRRDSVAADLARLAELEAVVRRMAHYADVLDGRAIPGIGGWAPPLDPSAKEEFGSSFASLRRELREAGRMV